jgi:hypothetical protein
MPSMKISKPIMINKILGFLVVGTKNIPFIKSINPTIISKIPTILYELVLFLFMSLSLLKDER